MATALVAAIAHAVQHGQFQNWGQPLPSGD